MKIVCRTERESERAPWLLGAGRPDWAIAFPGPCDRVSGIGILCPKTVRKLGSRTRPSPNATSIFQTNTNPKIKEQRGVSAVSTSQGIGGSDGLANTFIFVGKWLLPLEIHLPSLPESPHSAFSIDLRLNGGVRAWLKVCGCFIGQFQK